MSESDIVKRLLLRKEPTIEVDMHYPQIVDSDEPDAECVEAANTITALCARVEKLEKALKLFACDCTESSLCKFPHGCPNYIARAALGDTHDPR